MLAGDLARSGSEYGERGAPGAAAVPGSAAGARQIVSKLDSYGLRPESKAVGVHRKTLGQNEDKQ